jgi:hypothetical protein
MKFQTIIRIIISSFEKSGVDSLSMISLFIPEAFKE